MPRPSDERDLTEIMIQIHNDVIKIVKPIRNDSGWRLENNDVSVLTQNLIEVRRIKKDVTALEKKISKNIEMKNLKGNKYGSS
ncbi:MAG: hypothetical protein L0G13_03275 [Lactococcus lactis]|nr:hypothetical protein [Lactococcus lactis]